MEATIAIDTSVDSDCQLPAPILDLARQLLPTYLGMVVIMLLLTFFHLALPVFHRVGSQYTTAHHETRQSPSKSRELVGTTPTAQGKTDTLPGPPTALFHTFTLLRYLESS